MNRTVRILRTYDVVVVAEYGDTDEDLLAKADVDAADAGVETRVLLPDHQPHALTGEVGHPIEPESDPDEEA